MRARVDRLILRGLTFRERRRFSEVNPVAVRAPIAIGRTRLNTWRYWLTRGGRDVIGWNRFLADEQITEAEVIALSNCVTLKQNCPKWTKTLRGILEDLQEVNSRPLVGLRIARSIARPVACYARHELFKQLGSNTSMLSTAAESALANSLGQRLAASAAQVVYGLAAGEGDASKSTAFQLLSRYPVLARLWAVQVHCWLRFARDFVRDSQEFVVDRRLPISAKRHLISAIDSGFSDLHKGNRTVMRVRFADGCWWYYKPRSGEHEVQWFKLLRWINENGFQTPFKIVKIFSGHAHCWMEPILHRACRSRGDVVNYYLRAGAILYLIHLLRGVDFHAGNIIAHGHDPVLIDCETLLHPATRISRHVARYEEGSILRTGMLPAGDPATKTREEVSALGRRKFGDHSVRLNGQLMFADDFAENVVAGFAAMHTFLREKTKRNLRFRRILDGFNKLNCRYVYRPTAQYAWICEHSQSPSMLSDGLDHSLFLHALCRDGLIARRYVSKEIVALERGDIPIFYGPRSKGRSYLSEKSMTQSVALLRASISKP
jgi:Domain of unknown function (DUF4135)